MKTIKIELDWEWVLSRRDDGELPADKLAREVESFFAPKVKISSKTFTQVLLDADDYVESETFSVKTLELFKKLYPQAENNVISVYFGDVDCLKIDYDDEGDDEEDDEDEQEKEELSAIYRRILAGAGKEDDEPVSKEPTLKDKTENEANMRKVLEKVDELVGCDEFKALAREIADISGQIAENKTFDVFAAQNYLFSVGDGYGLTTYLKLLAELIEAMGVKKFSFIPTSELKLPPVKDSAEPFESVSEKLKFMQRDKLQLVCIDISEWINATDNRYFKEFLRELENNVSKVIVVFRVPFVDKSVLDKLSRSLNDVVFVKAVSFPPFTSDEIGRCAVKELDAYGFKLSKAAWGAFYERIAEEKRDGRFYGINTVRKVVRELLYKKQLKNARGKKSSRIIGKKEAELLIGERAKDNLSGEEMLKRLVGGGEIKKQIDEIVAQIELSLKDSKIDPPCIHMRFIGNPGTGKTTVARIIGKILKERGVLRVGNFYEVSGRDLCGRYIGETAPKTASICRDAYGSVLFVDEAYSLYRGDSDTRDYGREALDTLIAEMENHRNDFVVIMAGYPKEMKTLMEGNTGLKSRMPYTVEFPNFTKKQLCEVFRSMVGEIQTDKEFFAAAEEYFDSIPEEVLAAEDFANARFVRNLFERTWAKAAMRRQLNGSGKAALVKDDFVRAAADKDFAFDVKKKTKIGFQ